MNEVIEGLLYTRSHEWVQKLEGSRVRIGVTDHAQHELGDIVYIELSALGKVLAKGDEAGALESVKTVEPFYSPVGGKVVRVNEELEKQPELINRSPYLEGWLIELEMDSLQDMDGLLDSAAYSSLLEEA
ncbi:MAG: glycine cleavage system protein GcvH [Candidatus Methanomethylophilaceae archaeon]|nr:glycine cleavage system protein GcvH [Candidatus Methanomethylophilaceae archaeon]